MQYQGRWHTQLQPPSPTAVVLVNTTTCNPCGSNPGSSKAAAIPETTSSDNEAVEGGKCPFSNLARDNSCKRNQKLVL